MDKGVGRASCGAGVDGDDEPVPLDVLFLKLLVEKAVLLRNSRKREEDPITVCRDAMRDYLERKAARCDPQHIQSCAEPPLLGDVQTDFFEAAQRSWQRKIDSRLTLIITEHRLPLSLPVVSQTSSGLLSREAFVDSTKPAPLKTSMFVYDHQDLLREYLSLQNPNLREDAYAPLDYACPRFASPTLSDLQYLFRGLRPSVAQIGTHDSVYSTSRSTSPSSLQHHSQRAQRLAKECKPRQCRAICKRGCPTPYRPSVWFATFCGVDANDYALRYDELWSDIRRVRLPIDHVLAADAKYYTNLDDNYFVFYDLILEVLITFTRDKSLREKYCCTTLGADIIPSGIVPFRGLTFLAAPLAFLYSRPPTLYCVFIKLYKRYFRHLHTLSDHPNGIARLCQTFMDILQARLPHLLLHLKDLGVSPLDIAFPWMFQAFAGFLLPDQVLLLWDRMIGFDSLYVLPLLSFALFTLRQRALSVARSKREVEFVMADLRTVAVVPLLQYALFAKDIGNAGPSSSSTT